MYFKTSLKLNTSGTLITEELIPQRYNTVSKIKVSKPEENGINSTTTAKIQTIDSIEQQEDLKIEKDEKKTTSKQLFL